MPRQKLSLRISGLAPLSARIRWREGDVLGSEFMTPLHAAVFDHIVRSTKLAPGSCRLLPQKWIARP
jgi:hypothetical protein